MEEGESSEDGAGDGDGDDPIESGGVKAGIYAGGTPCGDLE